MRLLNRIDSGRFSIVVATILLAYSLTPFVTIPNRELAFQLPGFLFLLRVDYTGLVSILSAGLGATGMAWILQSRHNDILPGAEYQHYLLPALTAWAIGVPLGALEINLQWWVVFVFGGILLASVLYSEFLVIDLTDVRAPLATIGLSAVGYSIFFTLCVALRGAGLRLYLLLPVLFITAGMVSWRVLNLRSVLQKQFHWTVATTFLITQAAIGLHYLPITPIQFGLCLTGLCYGVISFAIQSENVNRVKRYWIEPVLGSIFFIGMAFIIKS
jgi:hypothetical protein